MSKNQKLKLLAWCDSPLSITGFGVVAKNILNRIYKTGQFDLACVGINHIEEHMEKAWSSREEDVPYRVYIGQDMRRDKSGALIPTDQMGRQKTIHMMKSSGCDVLFMMRDLWDMVYPNPPGTPHLSSFFPLHIQLAKEAGRNFRTLAHFPLEYQLQPDWRQMLDQIDYGYCFTQGGMQQLKPWEKKIKWAPQGADGHFFKRLSHIGWGDADLIIPIGGNQAIRRKETIKDSRDFRIRKMRLQDPDCFLVVNVNRNQPRKDIRATVKSFKKFKELVAKHGGTKRPVLWLQMRPDDNFGDARQVIQEEGLINDYDVQFPPYFNVGVGWSIEELNMLYNTADVFISTSVAEGFGLTPVEAGFAGCPVLVPGHSGFLQTVGELGMPYVDTNPQEIRREVSHSPVTPTNEDDMARKLLEHYMEPQKLRGLVDKNINKFRDLFDWDNIFKRYWDPVLQTIERDIRETTLRQEKNKDRLLFVCEEAFGDVLGATKAIDSIKREYPDVPLDFLTKNQYRGVVEENPDIDKVLEWDINKIFDYPNGRVFYPHAKIRHGGWSTGVTHLLDMQAEMVGFKAGEAKIIPEPFDTFLPWMPKDLEEDAVLPMITLHTTSQGGKMLTPDKWGELILKIANEIPEIKFILVGGHNDMLIDGAIDFRFDPAADGRPLAYRKMAWLQKHALCHVGIDSGPAHCASTVKTPNITFWGWTNYNTCKPQNYSINIVPHYPTVCPKMGPCHGVEPTCGINQYEINSAIQAPCVRSLSVQPAVDLILQAFKETGDLAAAREWLKTKAKKLKPIYTLPPKPHQRIQTQETE